MTGSSNGTYLTYNKLCDDVKTIVTKYWDNYYEKKNYIKHEIEEKKDEIEQLKKTIKVLPKHFGEHSYDNEKVGEDEKVKVGEQKEDDEAEIGLRSNRHGRRKIRDAPPLFAIRPDVISSDTNLGFDTNLEDKYQKYFTLLKQKIPEHNVIQTMVRHGVPSGIIDEIILKNQELRQQEVQLEEKSGEGELRMERGGGKGQGKEEGEVEIGQGKGEGEKDKEDEEKQRLVTELNEKIDDYEEYLFVKYFTDHSQDIKAHFGQEEFNDNTDIVEKLENFERKIMHIKISNHEKMKLFLCALWDNGYCIESLKMLFETVIFKNGIVTDLDDLHFSDKQIKSIYNDYRSKRKNFNHDNNDLKKRYSLYIFILHNCIL